jgi:hypothetical protein
MVDAQTIEPTSTSAALDTLGAGLGASTGALCSAPDVPPGTLPTRSGCQAAWPPESALTLLADDAVTTGSLSGRDAEGEEGSPREDSATPAPDVGCALVAAHAVGDRARREPRALPLPNLPNIITNHVVRTTPHEDS